MNIKILIWVVVFLSVLCGAMLALLTLSKLHDRQLRPLIEKT